MPLGSEGPCFLDYVEGSTTQTSSSGLNSMVPRARPENAQSLASICVHWHYRLQKFLHVDDSPAFPEAQRLRRQITISLEVIQRALDTYGPQELSLSYNGGKDCLVLLVLYLAALGQWEVRLSRMKTRKPNVNMQNGRLETHSQDETPPGTAVSSSLPTHARDHEPPIVRLPARLSSIYISAPSAFTQLTSFIQNTAVKYRLDLTSYLTRPRSPDPFTFRQAFVQYLRDRPQTRAILVGTRRTDPNGTDLGFFDETDGKWREEGASFMRVHPVIDWHYDEVWRFLRMVKDEEPGFEWCELYDQGYTSLGGEDDTIPNPMLRIEERGEVVGYRPAWELEDEAAERAGRKWP